LLLVFARAHHCFHGCLKFVEAQLLVFSCETSEGLEDHLGCVWVESEEVEGEADFVLVDGAVVFHVDEGEQKRNFDVGVLVLEALEHADHVFEVCVDHVPVHGALLLFRHEEADELDGNVYLKQREASVGALRELGPEGMQFLVGECVIALGQEVERLCEVVGAAEVFFFVFLEIFLVWWTDITVLAVEFQSQFLVLFLCSLVQSIQT